MMEARLPTARMVRPARIVAPYPGMDIDVLIREVVEADDPRSGRRRGDLSDVRFLVRRVERDQDPVCAVQGVAGQVLDVADGLAIARARDFRSALTYRHPARGIDSRAGRLDAHVHAGILRLVPDV